jgi:creatinine amidohydrolase
MKYRFAEMIWYEIKAAAEQGRVAVLPVATYEDHGPHLPVDVDVLLTNIRYVKDVCVSVAHDGFQRILLVNGHGSNTSPCDMAARLTIIETQGEVICASVNYWGLRKVREEGKLIRESDYGGTSHACEYETALYLALKPELVEMDKAVDERAPLPPSFQSDLLAGTHPQGSAANLNIYWSARTASGVMGDATKATREKGERFLAAAVDGLIELIREMKGTPILPRRDQHK